jgi:transcriptional regulator with XRE-family HTH domain
LDGETTLYVGGKMKSLLQQLKKRRLDLDLKQNDMMLRVGVSRQQYQRLESKGNPRIETLELIANGLKCEVMLIPKEKLNAVLAVLEGRPHLDGKANSESSDGVTLKPCKDTSLSKSKKEKSLSDDLLKDLQGDDS